MRLKIALAAGLLATVSVAAGDVFVEHNLDRANWINCFTQAVARDSWELPRGIEALKKLAPAQRAALINALGVFGKPYVSSPEFKAAYNRAYLDRIGNPPVDPSGSDAAIAKAKAQSDAGLKQMEEAIANMPPEMQAMVKAQMGQAKATSSSEMAKETAEAAKRKAKYEQDLAAYKAKTTAPGAMPKDPVTGVKRALQHFLNVTAGVDYEAPTTTKYAKKMFLSKALESKSDEWKMCYRAGRDACEAARSVAQNWIATLK